MIMPTVLKITSSIYIIGLYCIINRLYRYTIVNMLSKIYKYYKEVDGLIQYKFIHVLYKIFSNYHKNLQINNKRKYNIREILNNKS